MSQPTEHSQTNETRQPELKLQSLPRALGSRELQHRPAKEEQQLCPQHLPDRPELPAWQGAGGTAGGLCQGCGTHSHTNISRRWNCPDPG